jgi:hypothetical protein
MILTFYARVRAHTHTRTHTHTHTHIYIYIYIYVSDDELRLPKRAASINYLLRVVLDFNSVKFMFYFNWMCVNDYCIL